MVFRLPREKIERVKELIKKKLKIVEMPENGDDCVLVRELIVGNNYNAQVAVGKCWRYNAYYDVVGLVFEDTKKKFAESSIRIEKKLPKWTYVLCGVAPPGFWEQVDKSRLGIGNFEWDDSLDSLIKILESLEEEN